MHFFAKVRSALCPDVQKEPEVAYHFAQYLASLCRSLQYIQVEEWSWQVMTPPWLRPDDAVRGGDAHHSIELRPLEYEEVLAIEIFAMQKFVAQSSLTGSEEPHDIETEEERERTNRILIEVDLADRERLAAEDFFDDA